ncbi:hypothetical protein ACKKBG_A22865 [Auxenochlorella protothecoides x Auxenochlorella symbiontica]
MHSPSLYDALGVPATASLSEIRAAYKALAFKCHPDINPSAGKAGHREFVAATEAFQILRDGAKRAEYDRVLAFQRATEALQAGKPWDASHGAGPTPWGWEGPPRPAGRAAQREPLDDVFEDILRRMGQPGYRASAEASARRGRSDAQRAAAAAAAWQEEKAAAAGEKARTARLRGRMEAARAVRHARTLRTLWQTHGGVARQDVAVAVAFLAGSVALAVQWKAYLAAPGERTP